MVLFWNTIFNKKKHFFKYIDNNRYYSRKLIKIFKLRPDCGNIDFEETPMKIFSLT